MASLKNPLRFFGDIESVSKLGLISLGLASASLLILIIPNVVNRFTGTTLTLAAGDKQGESYIISKAIEEVVERKSNIKIEVKVTGGTKDNLEKLETGEAHLATAQADVITEEINTLINSNRQLSKPEPQIAERTVVVLYKDLFQLVVRYPNIKRFVDLERKTIAIPARGGQYESFQQVAKHFKLKDLKITGLDSNGKPIQGYSDKLADEDFINKKADALFRVRALGNKSISELLQNDSVRLLPIEQAEAMKILYPALESAKIPEGAYKGNLPKPEADLPTIAASRLLLASDKVNKDVIKEITRIIFENRREIANAVSPDNPEVKPLVATISQPDTTNSPGFPPLHPGAIAFYQQSQPSFIQENADYVALLLTVALLLISWLRQIKSWVESRRKNEADEYIESAIKLMNNNLGDVNLRQQLLDEAFNAAAKALIQERISQESFRTFNEAYKATREALERETEFTQENIEQKQRELAAKYIKEIVELLNYDLQDKDLIKQKIDRILKEVAQKLIADEISEESFRTFIEAYKTTKDAIDRN
ncbi:TAXI family TRAP transporter solute-binding subunit [Nostoc spongiaeforme FACHB-130]|uniref:TAXI family TRAP transporter solute-binding subunit n=1 Tax=Nostoc spongiaeforme FACHB-130 TaxID=1357510 RepID=A0ABR8FP25_9NOSO|nr:TAXI family TRAP transporter solute-binding subunit [Nostoc spongiaeforme]MBD2593224.1 TAXI family TRAP transporter solute-binding subunit [Nostoc spongiaeforme FACHB-130]